MKKLRKIKWGGALADIALELVLTLALFGIGCLVFSALGIEIDSIDSDLAVLVGILVVALTLACVAIIVHIIKRKSKNKNTEDK
jgi:hypothetical protein